MSDVFNPSRYLILRSYMTLGYNVLYGFLIFYSVVRPQYFESSLIDLIWDGVMVMSVYILILISPKDTIWRAAGPRLIEEAGGDRVDEPVLIPDAKRVSVEIAATPWTGQIIIEFNSELDTRVSPFFFIWQKRAVLKKAQAFADAANIPLVNHLDEHDGKAPNP